MKSNRRLAVSGSALSSAASPIACTMRTRSSMSIPPRTSPAACARARSSAPERRIASQAVGSPGPASSMASIASAARPRQRRRLRELSPQPGGEGLPRRVGGQQLVGLCLELLDAVAEDGLHEVLARREVPVERADADARGAGDLLHRRVRTPAREQPARRFHQARPVAERVGARLPRRGLLGGVDLDGVHAHGAVLPPDPPDRGWVRESTCKRRVPPLTIRRRRPYRSAYPHDRTPRGPTPRSAP